MDIPEISDAELTELLAQIKPLVRDEQGHRHTIAPVDPRRTAFTWDPKFVEMVEPGPVLAEFDTYHSFGAPALFKPSLAEVLAQIPRDLRPYVQAFELDTETAEIWDEGYHVASVTLYAELRDLSAGPRSRPSPLAEDS